jgi:tight adherence protein C
MRESLKQRADEKGNRAAFRLLFPTVFCLMPAVYLFLLGPAIIGLSDFFKSGGREQLEQGTRAIERLNTERENAGNRREQLGN